MLNFSASVNFLFGELPFLDRFSAARDVGIAGVEVQFLEAPVTEIAKAVADSGVEVVLINVDMKDLFDGGPGISGVPGRESHFEHAISEAAEVAEVLGAKFVHLGPSKVPAGVTRSQCLATYFTNVEKALKLDQFASGRSQALLEPMNTIDMPGALFSDIDEAASLLNMHFSGDVGLQFDVYHVEKGGKNALDKWRQYADDISHVQFSDVPDRQEPGTGTVPFDKLFAEIRESSYSGWVGAEYVPSIPTLDTLDWLKYKN